jgi:DNA-binding protein
MTDINTVYIGNKPPMSYVMALITAFNASKIDHVVLKARGRAISRAVDVAEIARHRFLRNVQATKIEIGSEQMPTPDGGTHGVSTIAITLKKIKGATDKAEAGTTEEEIEDVGVRIPPSADLSQIKGVGKAKAEKLKEAGFTTIGSVAASEPDALSEQTGISTKVAAKMIESAKELTK